MSIRTDSPKINPKKISALAIIGRVILFFIRQ